MIKAIKKLEDIELPSYLDDKTKIRSYVSPLDKMLQGGFTPGKIVQLVGEPKTGKTTIALQVAYGFCKQGKKVLYIDAKQDINTEYLQNTLLLDYYKNHFYLVKESTFSDVEEILEKFIKTGEIDLIIIDSLPSLINERCVQVSGTKRIKSDNTNTNSNTRPLIFLINKLKKLSIEQDMYLLFINEFRNKIDKRIGTITRVFGPKSLEYETSDIIHIKRITSSDNKSFRDCFISLEKVIGISDELVQLKGTSTFPLSPVPFFYEYGTGYQEKYNIIYYLLENKIIIKDGTYYEYLSYKANGLANLIKILTDNGELQKLVDKVHLNQS